MLTLLCRSEGPAGSMEGIEEKLGRATNYLHDIKVTFLRGGK